MDNNDILTELETEGIVELSAFYTKRQDVAPHIFSYLENTLTWQGQSHGSELVQVFVPKGNDWKTNGTFISVGHFPWKMIVTFTMEESGNQLFNALVKTNRFDYANDMYLYYALHEKHIPIVDKAMSQRGLTKISEDRTDLWRLDQKEGILKQPSFPNDYTMAPLNICDAGQVNDVWPHKSDSSEGYVRMLIELNGGWGLYTQESNELVAWILKSQLGQLALLQVTEDHQKKGLAQALVYALSKDIAQEGFPVLATIVQTNVASQNLFAKCGFEKLFMCTFNVYK